MAGLAASVVGIIWHIVAAPRYARLIRRESVSRARAMRRSVALQNIVESGMRSLMEDVKGTGRGVDFRKARASVYRYKNDEFILVARLSDAPALEKRGRASYPALGGLIGLAWEKGEGVVLDLPEDRQEWEDTCVNDYSMDRADVAGIAMQSKSLVGKRFDAPGNPKVRVGLLVMESLSKRGVNGGTLDAILASNTYPLLEQILIEAVACLDEQDVDELLTARGA